MAELASAFEGCVRNCNWQLPVTVVSRLEESELSANAGPVPTGVPLETAEPQLPVVAPQATFTLRVTANGAPGVPVVIPAIDTETPPAATVAVPVGEVAETIVKPDGALSESDPNDAPLLEALVKVAVIVCDDVPTLSVPGDITRLYVHGDDTVVANGLVERSGWKAKGTPPDAVGVLPVEAEGVGHV
jgi:hypothetical protein